MSEQPQQFLVNSSIPSKFHGWLLSWFADGARAGLTEPKIIINYLRTKTEKYLNDPYLTFEKFRTLKAFLKLLDSVGAIAFAQHALNQQKLDPRTRQQLKEARAEQCKQDWLVQQLVTTKQINYLTVLGYRGQPPQNKLEASQLIDKLLKQNEKGRAA
jgi:hypothetical protein